MRFTNSAVNPRRTVRVAAAAFLPWASFIWLAPAGDPFQSVRALCVSLAGVALLATGRTRVSQGRRSTHVAVIALGVLIAGYTLAWLVNGTASGVFGVHGRYAAVVTGALFVALGVAGSTLDVREVRIFGRSMAVALLVQSMVALVQTLTGRFVVGTIGNSALLGAWLAVALVVTLAMSRADRARWRMVEYSALVLGTLALGASGSRGAWLGAVAGVCVVIFAGQRRVRSLAIASAVVVALVLSAYLVGGEVGAKLDPGSLVRGSAASRLEIWRGTGALIVDNPVLGVGPGRFLYEFPRYEPLAHAVIEKPDVRADQAHSLPLQLAAESGLPAALAGLVLFGVALIAAWRGASSRSAAALMCVGGLAAFGVQGIFGISTVETDALAWLLGGCALGLTTPAVAAAGPRSARWVVNVALGLAIVAAVSSAWYIVADLSYGRGQTSFAAADFTTALADYRQATRLDPLVDVYRVGATDAVAYLRGAELAPTLESLERGLELEPDSYDLALARARLLADSGADADVVADAYSRAVELYPLGLEVRREAMGAYVAAGRIDEATALADAVLVLVPDDPIALEVKGLAYE